jgi:hypothetical protein
MSCSPTKSCKVGSICGYPANKCINKNPQPSIYDICQNKFGGAWAEKMKICMYQDGVPFSDTRSVGCHDQTKSGISGCAQANAQGTNVLGIMSLTDQNPPIQDFCSSNTFCEGQICGYPNQNRCMDSDLVKKYCESKYNTGEADGVCVFEGQSKGGMNPLLVTCHKKDTSCFASRPNSNWFVPDWLGQADNGFVPWSLINNVVKQGGDYPAKNYTCDVNDPSCGGITWDVAHKYDLSPQTQYVCGYDDTNNTFTAKKCGDISVWEASALCNRRKSCGVCAYDNIRTNQRKIMCNKQVNGKCPDTCPVASHMGIGWKNAGGSTTPFYSWDDISSGMKPGV